MADTPHSTLTFEGRCPDCATREVDLPGPLPQPGDDFDWLARDYDGLRRSMLEELAARFPGRTRWTPADLEVVLVELLAAGLDQLSDMIDRVAQEAYLETARQPTSVRRLLSLIGYDAVAMSESDLVLSAPDPPAKTAALERLWRQDPLLMDSARREGPRAIHSQRRMVTVGDYADRLAEHPLVLRASARSTWTGSWETIRVTMVLWEDRCLDDGPEGDPESPDYSPELVERIEQFHHVRGLRVPAWEPNPPTIRMVLHPYVEAYRMAGQEVFLEDAVPVGIAMSVSIRVRDTYFASEVRDAVRQALGRGTGGFFEPGRRGFGEDLYASDVYQVLMALDGVENACLNRFKRIGDQYPDQTGTGRIPLDGFEIAVCDNDPRLPERGYIYLTLSGGRPG